MGDKQQKTDKQPGRLSRRRFLRSAGVLAAGLGAAQALAACGVPSNAAAPAAPQTAGEGQLVPVSPQGNVPLMNPNTGKLIIYQQYPEVPFTPAGPPPANILRFFSLDEAKAVDALVSRILPGTPQDPGAHEAGVVTYIDNYLSYFGGDVEPTYRHPPYAVPYQGDTSPNGGSGPYDVVYVKKEELTRYGQQSIMSPAEQYRVAIAAIDAYAKKQFGGKKFADLSSDQQDQVIGDLASGKLDTLTEPTPHDFFNLVRTDVMQGMFADPVYGGNRDMAGWKLVGYPGAQRAYTPDDIHNGNFHRVPQSIAQLMPFHPGQPSGPDVILPVSGFDQQPK
jgi:gluconate 2-dehydrogenase gamma chain